MKKNLCALAALLITAVVATACGGGGSDIAVAVALTQTAAAIGQPTSPPVATQAPTQTLFPTPIPPQPTATAGPTNTPGASGCTNGVKFVADVTIPDKTVLTPGSTFTKIWRVRNTGTCTWDSSYHLAFAGGNQMGGPGSVSIAGNVAPGTEYDISVNMVAPAAPGQHQGRWQFVDKSGANFGLVYVLIVVPGEPTSTATPNVTAAPTIDLWADSTSLKAGECATVSWKVENVQAVFFNNEGTVGTGSKKVCPTQTTLYELRVEKKGGALETRQIKIEVSSVTPTPSIIQSGAVPLFAIAATPSPDAYLDLDSGAVKDVSNADVQLVLSGGTQMVYSLLPTNGALAKSMGNTEPGYAGCKGADSSLSSGSIPEVAVGKYVCIKTNKGRYSQLRFDTVEAVVSNNGGVRVTFTTWGQQ